MTKSYLLNIYSEKLRNFEDKNEIITKLDQKIKSEYGSIDLHSFLKNNFYFKFLPSRMIFDNFERKRNLKKKWKGIVKQTKINFDNFHYQKNMLKKRKEEQQNGEKLIKNIEIFSPEQTFYIFFSGNWDQIFFRILKKNMRNKFFRRKKHFFDIDVYKCKHSVKNLPAKLKPMMTRDFSTIYFEGNEYDKNPEIYLSKQF